MNDHAMRSMVIDNRNIIVRRIRAMKWIDFKIELIPKLLKEPKYELIAF
jgi:hypothetical protein